MYFGLFRQCAFDNHEECPKKIRGFPGRTGALCAVVSATVDLSARKTKTDGSVRLNVLRNGRPMA